MPNISIYLLVIDIKCIKEVKPFCIFAILSCDYAPETKKYICFWNIIQTARESQWKKNKYFQLLTGGVWRRTGGVNAFVLPYLPRLHRFERTVKRRTRSNTYHTLTAFTVKGVGRFSFCRRPTAVFSVYVVFGRVSR